MKLSLLTAFAAFFAATGAVPAVGKPLAAGNVTSVDPPQLPLDATYCLVKTGLCPEGYECRPGDAENRGCGYWALGHCEDEFGVCSPRFDMPEFPDGPPPIGKPAKAQPPPHKASPINRNVDAKFKCASDADCGQVNIHTCCGPVPICANKAAEFPPLTPSHCVNKTWLCGYLPIAGCMCQEGACIETGRTVYGSSNSTLPPIRRSVDVDDGADEEDRHRRPNLPKPHHPKPHHPLARRSVDVDDGADEEDMRRRPHHPEPHPPKLQHTAAKGVPWEPHPPIRRSVDVDDDADNVHPHRRPHHPRSHHPKPNHPPTRRSVDIGVVEPAAEPWRHPRYTTTHHAPAKGKSSALDPPKKPPLTPAKGKPAPSHPPRRRAVEDFDENPYTKPNPHTQPVTKQKPQPPFSVTTRSPIHGTTPAVLPPPNRRAVNDFDINLQPPLRSTTHVPQAVVTVTVAAVTVTQFWPTVPPNQHSESEDIPVVGEKRSDEGPLHHRPKPRPTHTNPSRIWPPTGDVHEAAMGPVGYNVADFHRALASRDLNPSDGWISDCRPLNQFLQCPDYYVLDLFFPSGCLNPDPDIDRCGRGQGHRMIDIDSPPPPGSPTPPPPAFPNVAEVQGWEAENLMKRTVVFPAKCDKKHRCPNGKHCTVILPEGCSDPDSKVCGAQGFCFDDTVLSSGAEEMSDVRDSEADELSKRADPSPMSCNPFDDVDKCPAHYRCTLIHPPACKNPVFCKFTKGFCLADPNDPPPTSKDASIQPRQPRQPPHSVACGEEGWCSEGFECKPVTMKGCTPKSKVCIKNNICVSNLPEI